MPTTTLIVILFGDQTNELRNKDIENERGKERIGIITEIYELRGPCDERGRRRRE